MKSFLILAALVLPLAANADLKQIQGKWKPTGGQVGATKLPKSMLDKMVLVIKGEAYDYSEGNGHDIGTLKLVGKDGLDILGTTGPNKGKTYLTIFKFEHDTLTICYGLDGKRPASFEVNAKSKAMLMTYKLAKE